MDELDIEFQQEGNKAILFLRGDLNREQDRVLEQAISDLIAMDAPNLVLDMRGIRFVASMCFGVLIFKGQVALEQNRRLVVILSKHLASLARDIGVEQIVTIQEA